MGQRKASNVSANGDRRAEVQSILHMNHVRFHFNGTEQFFVTFDWTYRSYMFE